VNERSPEVEALIARGSYGAAEELQEAERGQRAIDAAARLEALQLRARGYKVEDEAAAADAALLLLAEEEKYLGTVSDFVSALQAIVIVGAEARDARISYEKAWAKSRKLNGDSVRVKIAPLAIPRSDAVVAASVRV
jgi:phosphoribosylamine-glycine ligase